MIGKLKSALRYRLKSFLAEPSGPQGGTRCLNCEALVRKYEEILSDPDKTWLYLHRDERMDATLDLFTEARREFHLDRYRFACKFTRGKVVADIACGTGYGTELLWGAGEGSKVYGIDIDARAVAYAQAQHGATRIEYQCASATKTGLADASVDVVVSFETIEHVENDQELIEEFHRILKKGGTLICSTPNRWPLAYAIHHVKEYDEESFVELLTGRFEVEGLYNQNSGDSSLYNHRQPRGIVATTSNNASLAECFLAVCRKT